MVPFTHGMFFVANLLQFFTAQFFALDPFLSHDFCSAEWFFMFKLVGHCCLYCSWLHCCLFFQYIIDMNIYWSISKARHILWIQQHSILKHFYIYTPLFIIIMNRRKKKARAALLLFRRKKYNWRYWVHPINQMRKDLEKISRQVLYLLQNEYWAIWYHSCSNSACDLQTQQ